MTGQSRPGRYPVEMRDRAVFTEAEIREVWERRKAGELNRSIGRRLGRSGASIRAVVESSGGVRPVVRHRSSRQLSVSEREEISRGVAAGASLRVIASRLGRAVSTVSRELARNGGRLRYRAHRADQAAWQRAHSVTEPTYPGRARSDASHVARTRRPTIH